MSENRGVIGGVNCLAVSSIGFGGVYYLSRENIIEGAKVPELLSPLPLSPNFPHSLKRERQGVGNAHKTPRPTPDLLYLGDRGV